MAEKEAAKPITNWLSGWSEGEAAVTSSNKTLAELFGVDPKVLRDKFDLEPGWQYDPTQNENLVFLSPTVLLNDLKIRDGGPKDRGPKEILSRVVRDMLDPKQTKHYEKPYFFQVPEIPNMHMGYGLTSENKKNKMAITKEEGKLWIRFLDLAKRKKPGEVLNESGGTSEEPMEVVTYPTPEDTQAFEFEKGDAEELINPENSGLKRPVKGSYLLFFSILLIFYQKKLQAKEYSRDKGTQIGPNKISDFHIFWILPYLLNFNHRKVNDIINHHRRISEEKGEPVFECQIIQKSAKDIMESAFNFSNTPPPISGFLKRKFEKYYGKACAIKYNLPQSPKGTPIILVPSSYQVTDMPVVLEDLGSSWREIGDITLVDQFIEKFVESGEIQRDFFCSFEHVEKRFCVDYGIILPDLQTFEELMGQVESQDSSIFQEVKEQGQDSPSPRLGLIKHPERSQSVCFSYLPGKDPHNVEKMFRLVSSNRLNSFTLVLLYGSAFHFEDANCKLLSLYPVKGCRKCVFQDDEMVPEKSLKEFEAVVGKFSQLDFPETYLSLEREIQRDEAVREIRSVLSEETELNLSNPEFVRGEPVEVFYATVKDQVKLKNYVINLEMQGCFGRRVANLDGSLLSSIFREHRKVGVVTAINNVIRPNGSLHADLQRASRIKKDLFPLRKLERAVRSVIVHFVRAIVVAGLPEVYPPTPGNGVEDDEMEDNKGSSSNEEQVMSDIASGLNLSWESQTASASNYSPGIKDQLSVIRHANRKRQPGRFKQGSQDKKDSSRGQKRSRFQFDKEETKKDDHKKTELKEVSSGRSPSSSEKNRAEPTQDQSVKQGTPSYDELERLASKLGDVWKKLGRRLGIEEPKLDEVSKLNEELSEKGYKMLRHWKGLNGSAATYQILVQALQHELVNLRDLAEEFCYEQQQMEICP